MALYRQPCRLVARLIGLPLVVGIAAGLDKELQATRLGLRLFAALGNGIK